jgi:DNA-binding LacI/PurR family transcriptional regulator
VVSGGQAQVDGQRAARHLVEQGELPTALIAYNDDTATAVMGVLAQQGIAVPADVSVIGWDDSEAAALSLVGLTSVVQQPAELARLAVDRIVDRLNRRRVQDREIVLQPDLRVRDSTAPPPARMS